MTSCWKPYALPVPFSSHVCARHLEINVPLLWVSGLECADTQKCTSSHQIAAEWLRTNCVCKCWVRLLHLLGLDTQTHGKRRRSRNLTREFPLAQQQPCIPQAGSGERPGSASAPSKHSWAVPAHGTVSTCGGLEFECLEFEQETAVCSEQKYQEVFCILICFLVKSLVGDEM